MRPSRYAPASICARLDHQQPRARAASITAAPPRVSPRHARRHQRAESRAAARLLESMAPNRQQPPPYRRQPRRRDDHGAPPAIPRSPPAARRQPRRGRQQPPPAQPAPDATARESAPRTAPAGPHRAARGAPSQPRRQGVARLVSYRQRRAAGRRQRARPSRPFSTWAVFSAAAKSRHNSARCYPEKFPHRPFFRRGAKTAIMARVLPSKLFFQPPRAAAIMTCVLPSRIPRGRLSSGRRGAA